MYEGFDVGDMMGTLKEAVLLKYADRQENLEYLSLLIKYKSNLLKDAGEDQFNKFNELLTKYYERYTNHVLKSDTLDKKMENFDKIKII